MALDTSKALVEPAPAMRIDEVALARYLQSHVKDFAADSVRTFQFSHGQSNPTYLVKGGGGSYVLRKKPPGKVLPSAHAVDREYRVLAALQGTAVPVPRTVLLCEDSAVLGTPFYLMEHVKGRIYADPSLPGVEPADRARIYEGMARTLAALHSVDPAAVGLAGYGKARGYNRRQVWRWGQQYLKSVQGEPMPEMVRLMQWLESHIPAGDDKPSVTRISHGDYRLDNLVMSEGNPGQVLAVLDWELSTLGDPLADLAYNCLPYVMPSDVPSLPSLPRPLPSGIPEEQDYIQMYCEARGIAYPLQADWPFYLALSLFRLCSILAGVGARAAQGNASSRIAGQVGADSVVRSLAVTGLRIVGEAPAPAPAPARAAAHAVLTGTPQEPYVNPRHPAARPDPNRLYQGNPLEEYANPSAAWQSAAGKAEQALREVDNMLPPTAGGTASTGHKVQRGAGGASLARNPTAAAGKPARISGATAAEGISGASGEFVREGLAGVGKGELLPTGNGGATGPGPRISEETAEGGIVGASGEFVREGLRGVGSGELLPTGHSPAVSPGLGPSPRVQPILQKLKAFMEEHVYPAEAVLGAHAHSDKRWTIHPLQEELKEEAKRQGLWNLWLPADMARGLTPLMDLLGVQGAERAALLGPGLTNLEYAHCAEVMGRSLWAPECFNCSAPDTGNMEVLARYGSRSQQQRWLVPLLGGDIRSAFAMTEPAVASSDATNIQASIVKTPEGGYVLNGRKWWTSGACDPRCKIAIFMGKSDPSGPTHAQQSMVLVPMDAPGVTVIRPLPVFGYDDAPHGHAECNFEDVRVPGDNMILGKGRGFEIAQGRLGPGRLHHCMRTLGAAERALELMVKRAGDRTAFGASLYRHQSVRLDIANSRVELDAARLVVLEAARALDEVGNKAARGKIAAAKALAPTAALRIIDRAIQVHGGAGVTDVTPLAHMWAGIRTLRLADGPDVVHLETIAKLELAAVARRARM